MAIVAFATMALAAIALAAADDVLNRHAQPHALFNIGGEKQRIPLPQAILLFKQAPRLVVGEHDCRCTVEKYDAELSQIQRAFKCFEPARARPLELPKPEIADGKGAARDA